jgi:Zn-dependent alcohol dehydrogenase
VKIRAAVLEKMGVPGPYAQTRPLAIREIALAPPGAGEVSWPPGYAIPIFR